MYIIKKSKGPRSAKTFLRKKWKKEKKQVVLKALALSHKTYYKAAFIKTVSFVQTRMDSISTNSGDFEEKSVRSFGYQQGQITWSQSGEAIVQKNNGYYCAYEKTE